MLFLNKALSKLIPSFHSVDEWMVIYEELLHMKDIKDKTISNRLNNCRKIREVFGQRSLRSITPTEITRYISSKYSTSPHEARRLLIEIKEIFREAVNHGWVKADPSLNIKQRKVPVKRSRLSFEVYSKMLDASPDDSSIRGLLLLALSTGQRRGDLVKMKFSDVWEEADGEKYLHVCQEKTGKLLAIPLSLKLSCLGLNLNQIILYCKYYTKVSPDSFLLRKTTDEPYCVAYLSSSFEALRDSVITRESFDGTPPSLHECRSLSARCYDAEGFTQVQALLGHSSLTMTEMYKNDRGLDKRDKNWKKVCTFKNTVTSSLKIPKLHTITKTNQGS